MPPTEPCCGSRWAAEAGLYGPLASATQLPSRAGGSPLWSASWHAGFLAARAPSAA